jgi:predicted nucleotidyltransferase
MDTEAIEARLREFFAANAEREGIAAAYLFGSVARGTAGPQSDVVVGVLYSEDVLLPLEDSDLAQRIEDLIGHPINVVILNRAMPELVIRIFREGKLLLEQNRSQRVQFEVQSRNEFWDFEPNLRLYRTKNNLPDPSLEDLSQRDRQTRQ